MNVDINLLLKTIIEQTNIKSLDLNDAKKIFLLKYNQNLQTKNYYNKNLIDIINHLSDIGINQTNQITTVSLQYIVNVLSDKNKPQTINKKINSLITMLKYLSEELELITYPSIKFKKLKEDNFQGKVITPEEINLIYNYLQKQSLKKQILFRLFLETGVRRTECTRIKIENINFENQTIFLQNLDTKSKKSRFLFLQDDTNELLKEYIEVYKPKYFLFENNDHEQFSPSSITSIIDRIKKDLDLNNLSPHILRRSFATYMLDNGANIISVKELLGHSTLSQTQKYCLASLKQQQRDCLKYNPSKYKKNA